MASKRASTLPDTLNEISTAINNDPNLYQTIVTLVNNKTTETREYADEAVTRGIAVDAVSGKISDLASLITETKVSVVAVNEVREDMSEHVNNASVHVSTVKKKTFLALVQQPGSDFVIDCN